ncbi:MAG: SprT family zinc-dependent metalloprotease [Thermoleophilaceae bacterium]
MGSIEYTVRRSERARRARVEVSAGGVEVVVPRRMALRHVAPFVEEKRRWIERTLRRYEEAVRSLPAARLAHGGSVPLLGRELELSVLVEPGRVRARVRLRGDRRLEVAVGEPGPDALRKALEPWYRRRAEAEIGPRLSAAAMRAGASYGRLVIRNQRTRWASCSSSGTMSFNWRLLLAPEAVLEYVIEHEVAHLAVPDHSRRFWALLAERCPAYREHERWLRDHGPALRL